MCRTHGQKNAALVKKGRLEHKNLIQIKPVLLLQEPLSLQPWQLCEPDS